MNKPTHSRRGLIAVIALAVLLCPVMVFAAEKEYVPDMYATFWSLVPPVVAIVLALITKEVYSSLFIGIVIGALFYSGFSFEGTVNHVLSGGVISVLSDTYNVGIIVFLVILGIMVCLMNQTGGSAAFGRWAKARIKSRVGGSARHGPSGNHDIRGRLFQLPDSGKRYASRYR